MCQTYGRKLTTVAFARDTFSMFSRKKFDFKSKNEITNDDFSEDICLISFCIVCRLLVV